MSLQMMKRNLLRDLRPKRNKKRDIIRCGILFLLALVVSCAYLVWVDGRPAALLQQGIRLEQQTQLNEALDRYSKIFKDYKHSPEAAAALYRSGMILQHERGKNQQASLFYLQLEHDYPQSLFVTQSQQQLAELTKYRLNDCEQAISIFQRLVENSAVDNDHYQYELADCYVRLENWSQAAIEFESLLINYPQSTLNAITAFRLANAWLLSGQRARARAGFAQVVADFSTDVIAQEALFRLAEMLEEEEQLNAALQSYSALTAYPQQALLKQKILRLKERIARKKKVL